jgi:hypothetical protein
VAIKVAVKVFLQVGLGVLCFVGRVRRLVRSLWQEALLSG